MVPHRYTPSSSAAVQSETSAGAAPPGPYYGEPHKFDPSFRGPVHKRSCTDVLCCLIFIIVILSYVALGIVAWLHGDPRKVLHPTDSYGQFCGQKGTTNAKKPILFYFNILKCTNPTILINLQCPTTQMCVSKCPDKFATYTEMQLQHKLGKSSWEYYRQFCKPGFNNPDKPVSQVLRDEDCPSMIVPSRPFLQRCLPDFITLNGTVTVANRTRFKDALEMARSVTELQHAAKGITELMDTKELGMKIVEDYAKSWAWILIGLLLSLAVSLVFILLLRFTAGLLLWTTIIAVILLLAYAMWYCSTELSQIRDRPGSDVAIVEVGLHTDLQVYLQLTQTWIILLVSLGVTEASILLMLIFLRRRVRVAIALLREASKAIGHIMSTLFFPVITFLLLTVCISYWAVTAVYLASSGEAVYKVMSPDGSCPYANSTCNPETFNGTNISKTALCLGSQCLFAFYGGETSYHRYLFLLQLSNLLVFLWLVNFSLALEQCTLAGTFSSYYWAKRKPHDITPFPLLSSFCRAIRYHTGSLAFGSLILAVAQLVRIILEYLEEKLKGADNSLSKFIMHCLKCCFWCLEKFIRHMNRNAYIMVAVYGKNFCTSAREAFFLLMRNVVRVAVLDRVTDFLLFLGKVLIAGGVGVVAFFFFTRKIPVFQEEVPNLNCYWVPLLTVVIGAYLIAHSFFSVYAMCVDTLFLCFCDDLERNDGSSEKPFLMSPELHRILGKSSQLR
ncbi:choline transporter-like protein 5-A isoform X1 [Micropterus salmoides]|uniref:choline transporter-like protein 5-A isoform X1 n=2 Tax=Micropterus salmoides TaxID=27706 RepID=UPI0018EE4438|nr:choline transporter-like protein 5-A isoform X1 [Micropterus salmoides]